MKEKRIWQGFIVKAMLILTFILVLGVGNQSKVSAASKDDYQIKVNKKMNTITIYKRDSSGKYTVPVKAMVCSTGEATPIGTFKTPEKYRWKLLVGNVWGQYSTRITGSFLFHSVWYHKKDPSTLSTTQYNRLGTTASKGCIRLTTADAKWIYDNCGIGTAVVIYNSSNPGPLGKPEAIKLSGKYTWDPTDIWSKNNPYNNMKPTITGIKDTTVEVGTKVDLKKGVKAYNTTGYDVTSRLKITGSVDTSKVGSYKVTYSVTDEIDRTVKKTITYKVIGNETAPTLKGVKKRLYNYNTYKDKKFSTYAYEGVTAKIGNQTLSSKYLSYTKEKVEDSNSKVRYKVTYTATSPYSNKSTSKTTYIVLDKQAPTIRTTEKLYMTSSEYKTLQQQLKAGQYSGVTIADNCSNVSKLQLSHNIVKKNSKRYNITYTVKDEAGLSSSVMVRVYIQQ